MDNEKDTCQVFISYSHSSHNVDFLELLCSKFREANIQIWMDTTSIKVGEEWRVAIDSGILGSDAILVIFDEAACASPYVTYEWAFALGSGKTIIPILMADCKLHERITVLQYFDFRNKNRPWDKLIERIKAVQMKRKESIAATDLPLTELLIEFEKILDANKNLANIHIKDTTVGETKLISTTRRRAHTKEQINSVSDESKTILWVDDRSDFKVYWRRTFESRGFLIDMALSTDEALSLFAKNKYCVIITSFSSLEEAGGRNMLLEAIRKLDKSIPYFIYFYCSVGNFTNYTMNALIRGAQGVTRNLPELVSLVELHVQQK